jgi:predicted DNA-binding antitoxin AbrB/MazE fold protein
MANFVKAVYRDGVFVPLTHCDIPESTEVQVWFHNPYVIPPTVTDPEKKRRILREVVEEMRKNPIPLNSPRFTREELHERR